MRTILPIAGVILALISAGCIAYIAWELTNEASKDGKTDPTKKESDDHSSDSG